MNEKDVILKVSEKTGIKEEECANIILKFEKQYELALENKFKGIKTSKYEINNNISKETGYSLEKCEMVTSTLKEVMDKGLSNKLRFIKNK